MLVNIVSIFLINFVGLYLLIAAFGIKLENIHLRILVLTIIFIVTNFFLIPFGSVGSAVSSIINIILIKKTLGYSYLSAFFFGILLSALNLSIFALVTKYVSQYI